MMKRFAIVASLIAALTGSAFAQGGPSGGGPGPQPTNPWIINGNTVSPNGLKVVTAASATASAGFNLPPGTAPTSPVNGDVWTTSSGVFARINGSTVGPLGIASVPGGASTDIQYNHSGAFLGDAGFTYAGNGQVSIALNSITTNLKALSITGTWNASGTTFDAPLLVDITNTASNVASLLFDFQVGGSSILTLSAASSLTNSPPVLSLTGGVIELGAGSTSGVLINNSGGGPYSGFFGGSNTIMGWASGNVGQTADTALSRDSAGVLDLGSGAVGNKSGQLNLTVLQSVGVAFASLPASPAVGMVAYVTDSTTATWGATIAGGGSDKVLAWYNNSHWTVIGA